MGIGDDIAKCSERIVELGAINSEGFSKGFEVIKEKCNKEIDRLLFKESINEDGALYILGKISALRQLMALPDIINEEMQAEDTRLLDLIKLQQKKEILYEP